MKHPDTVSFMSAQITIANWYLDRAAQDHGETSSYVRYAQQAYDIVSHLLPPWTLDDTSQRVHQQLSALRERLRRAHGKHNGLDGHATASRRLLPDSALGDGD